MPSTANKYLDYAGAKFLWDKAAEIYVQKEEGKVLSDENYSSAEKEKLAGLENYVLPAATGNTLGGVKPGAGLTVDEQGVLSATNTGDIQWTNIVNVPTTVSGYGITDAATKTELDEVRESVSKAYSYKGSVDTYADLEAIVDPLEGDMYNVKENGKSYAWAIKEGVGMWDDLGSVFDMDSITTHEIDIITGYTVNEITFNEIIEEGGNIWLASNLTLTEPKLVEENVVIDLDQKTISSSIQGDPSIALFTVDGGSLTIKGAGHITSQNRIANVINGGTFIIENVAVNTSGDGVTVSDASSEFVFNGGMLEAYNKAVYVYDGGSVEINGGTINSSDNVALSTAEGEDFGGNIIVLNGGTIIGNSVTSGRESCAVYIANDDSFTMNGGVLTSNDGCGLLQRSGTVEINGGVIQAHKAEQDSHSPGQVGSDDTLMSASAIIYHQTAGNYGSENMSLTINDGYFEGVDHSLEVLSNEVSPSVTVNGGGFSPTYPEE